MPKTKKVPEGQTSLFDLLGEAGTPIEPEKPAKKPATRKRTTAPKSSTEAKGKKEIPANPTAKQAKEILNEKRNSRGRGRSAWEKRASYANYRRIKRDVVEMEDKNFDRLILFPASDFDTNEKKFYKMGGNSAVIYVHELAPRLGRKNVALHTDLDSCGDDEKFPSGVCSVLDIENLEKKLAKIDVERVRTNGPLIIFKLNREYSKSELKAMRKLEQKRLDDLNKIIFAEVLYPDIHKLIINLERLIPSKVKNMPSAFRETIGVRTLDTVFDMIEVYVAMTHGEIPPVEAGEQLNRYCIKLLTALSIIEQQKIWDVISLARIADTVKGIKQLVRGKILK